MRTRWLSVVGRTRRRPRGAARRPTLKPGAERLEARLTPAGQFLTAPTAPVGPTPLAGAVGDFNGDGIPDVATANADQSSSTAGSVSVLLGNGDGTFKAAINSPAGHSPGALAVGDLNGDGKADIVVANILDDTLNVLLGNGDGTFRAPAPITVGMSPASVVLGDFNGDKKLDIAVSMQGQNALLVLPGKGDGTFGAAVSTPAFGWGWLASGDFNRDGKLDVAFAGDSLVSVLLGNGDGTFGAPVSFATMGSPFRIAVADVNGDGRIDLVTSNFPYGGGEPGYINVLLGSGDGNFGADLVTRAPGEEHDGLALADFDGDGKLDLATTCFDQGEVAVLRGRGDGTFFGPDLYVSDQEPFDLLAADFDGDGRPDLAAINTREFRGNGTVGVLLNRGDGTFNAAPAFDIGSGPIAIAQADFDGDGRPDLAVANSSSDDVSILLNAGSGRFRPAVSYGAGSHPVAVVAGDFNGDGRADLALANQGSNDISILLGNGDGTFRAAVSYAAGQSPAGLVTGDFNGDGKLDLAATGLYDATVSVLLGRGDGSFGAARGFAAGQFPVGIATADLDGDGKLDLVVGNSFTNGVVQVLRGLGDGTFAAPVTYTTGASYSEEVALADLNGDGRPDLVVANDGDTVVTVLLNRGGGTFAAPTNYASGTNPYGLAVADFNGDGIPDIAATNSTNPDNTVSLFLGRGDGTFASADSYVSASNPYGLVAADFNGDGTPDLAVANLDGTVSLLANAQRLPILAIGDARIQEGDAGATTIQFNVTLSAPSLVPVTVNYATSDGTARSVEDYIAASGTLTLQPGETSKTIAIQVVGDTRYEADETFSVNLSNPTAARLGAARGIGTILNDDPPPAISIDDVALREGNSGTTDFAFSVHLSAASGLDTSVSFSTQDGTASALSDYQAASGTLVIPAGSTSATIHVAVLGDLVVEPDETFSVVLANPSNATIARGQAVGTVLNDDGGPAAPSAPDLQATSDSGASAADNLTNLTHLVFDVGGVLPNVTLRLLRDGVVVNSQAVTVGGTVAIDDPGPVPQGVHAYTADQADSAGNRSVPGGVSNVTIDTNPPVSPSAPVLEAASDSGPGASDGITNVTSPIFDLSGIESGVARLVLLRDGAIVATLDNPNGPTASIQDAGPVPEGLYSYAAQQVDAAGNISAVGPSRSVQILTTPPPALAAPSLDAASDNGVSPTDGITSVTRPTLNVSAPAGMTVQLLRDGVFVGSRVGPGALTEPTNLPDGVYRYTTRPMDPAGNLGAESVALAVTVLTKAPAPPRRRCSCRRAPRCRVSRSGSRTSTARRSPSPSPTGAASFSSIEGIKSWVAGSGRGRSGTPGRSRTGRMRTRPSRSTRSTSPACRAARRT